MPFLDVRDPVTKKLLCRYDPESEVLSIKRGHGDVREIYLSVIRERYYKQKETTMSVTNAFPENAAERQETNECPVFTDGALTAS